MLVARSIILAASEKLQDPKGLLRLNFRLILWRSFLSGPHATASLQVRYAIICGCNT